MVAYVDGRSRQTFESVNPATGQTICALQVACTEDVDLAVASAREGFAVWSRMTGTQRGRVLMDAVRLLRERNRELAELEVQDTGKPIQEAEVVDVASGADCIEYFAGLASKLEGSCVDLGSAFFYTRREPLGVCAGIGAWNYPIQIACWKSAPALACGNAMIFKPSEMTPLTALKLAEIYSEAGLPDGVFNVVNGFGATGMALVSHLGVAKISLTGSVATGKEVMAVGARILKHVTLELGGKSPLLIFDDADLDQAVSAAMMVNFYTQGQVCTNGTRVFVQEGIHDDFMRRPSERTRKIRIGDPMDPETQMGSLISQKHLDTVLGYIEAGKAEGAELVSGGGRVNSRSLSNGFFVELTVFNSCTDDMTIVREEIFGPVMSVLVFRDEHEVVQRANHTEFGLAAGLFTSDLKRAHRIVAQLQAGICWINNYNITPIEMPFGGYKESGYGRENGLAALEHYTQLKSVYVEMGTVESSF